MRELTAKDVMNPEILKVRDDMTVAELAEFLVEILEQPDDLGLPIGVGRRQELDQEEAVRALPGGVVEALGLLLLGHVIDPDLG